MGLIGVIGYLQWIGLGMNCRVITGINIESIHCPRKVLCLVCGRVLLVFACCVAGAACGADDARFMNGDLTGR